jgi:hypothetical protein
MVVVGATYKREREKGKEEKRVERGNEGSFL